MLDFLSPYFIGAGIVTIFFFVVMIFFAKKVWHTYHGNIGKLFKVLNYILILLGIVFLILGIQTFL